MTEKTEENVRPWGRYDILHENDNSKTKVIKVNPGQAFSLQYHNERDEYWIIIEGSGKVIEGESEREVSVGDSVNIPKRTKHRATANEEGLVFIETQVGNCREEDIVRLEDKYGRTEK